MRIIKYADVPAVDVEEGFKFRMRLLNAEGSENFAVRHCEFEPGGFSALHSHDFGHEIFILEGQGSLVGEKGTATIVAGDAISIPAGETHQMKNTGQTTLRLLCMEPK